ncbi:MipA/OmpV family protein [Microbulbifer sp. TYP-18]|uniref:MipA/OmpV family protein n=1 Tax=Microbulbifer sp. TYP-18 TaxID=3230024 RepID=UPI0034C6668C
MTSKILLSTLLFLYSAASVAEVTVRLLNAPEEGSLVLQVYDDPDAFGDFRNPAREERYSIQPDGSYRLSDLPAGQIVVLAYVDENDNGVLDRNFIGIPREPMGLSNNYQPKGPPSFQRAAFYAANDQAISLDIELYSVLGEFGQWGVGLGVIGRSSPYRGSDTNVTQVIPAITYFGERLQWIGPELRYGIAGSDKLRLAVIAAYRLGAYEEDDSYVLEGLGDREDTLFGGIGLIYEAWNGFELDLQYTHDLLDRSGGGLAEVRLSRGFHLGNWRLVPRLGINWLSSELANYDYGVPVSAAEPGRPAYEVGSSVTAEAGVGTIWELSEDWRMALNLAVERLDNDINNSPIVTDRQLLKGFIAVTYTL